MEIPQSLMILLSSDVLSRDLLLRNPPTESTVFPKPGAEPMVQWSGGYDVFNMLLELLADNWLGVAAQISVISVNAGGTGRRNITVYSSVYINRINYLGNTIYGTYVQYVGRFLRFAWSHEYVSGPRLMGT